MSHTELETPDHIFDPLLEEFRLNVDICATDANAKLPRYYTKEMVEHGLAVQLFSSDRIWCNPPYGRGLIYPWVRRCYLRRGLAVMLLPAWTDRDWFQDFIWDGDHARPGVTVRFLKERIRFLEHGVPTKMSGTFGSMVVIFEV